jgi:hypothetical protein
VTATIERCLSQQEATIEAAGRLLWEKEAETRWAKMDHLLYLPVLGLRRPRDLYYDQGPGLRVLYGFSYKYLTVEHFLGRLTRLGVGQPMADALAHAYSQAWYPGEAPLPIYVDWHVKPHWTKYPAHSGAVTMWGRVMPGTKQLIINGSDGQLLGGWNMAMDRHLSGVLVDLEAWLARVLQRPIAYTVCDSEGGGRPLGQKYRDAEQPYLSYLPRQGYPLTDFEICGDWQAVTDDPDREVVLAHWQDPIKAAAEPRDLILMRRRGETDPTRIYTGNLPETIDLAEVPAVYRQRWRCQERVIRELVNGANLNANFGYAYDHVPNRTLQRQWADAQERVEASERHLSRTTEAIRNRQQQLVTLRSDFQHQARSLNDHLARHQTEFLTRQAEARPLRRCQQRLAQIFRHLDQARTRYQRRRHNLLAHLRDQRTSATQAQADLSRHQQTRDALDTETLCRERHLEKDQIMLNLQLGLANLHHWTRDHYLAPEWQHLELPTATQLIYRKAGWVHWAPDQIDVTLEPYRYPEHQRAMEETCRRFNDRNLLWRDGRPLRIQVASP